MLKIDRNALMQAEIAGGCNKGSSTSASTNTVVVVQAAASSTSQPARH